MCKCVWVCVQCACLCTWRLQVDGRSLSLLSLSFYLNFCHFSFYVLEYILLGTEFESRYYNMRGKHSATKLSPWPATLVLRQSFLENLEPSVQLNWLASKPPALRLQMCTAS